MNDPVSYVLKEKKYVSSDTERDAYLVRAVPAGGMLRIIKAEGRWKQVEVIENGKAVATGWLDAHFVKNVEKVQTLPPSANPQPPTRAD